MKKNYENENYLEWFLLRPPKTSGVRVYTFSWLLNVCNSGYYQIYFNIGIFTHFVLGSRFSFSREKTTPCMPHPGWAIFAYQWQTHKEHEEFIACWFWIGVTQHVDPAQLLAKNNRKILWQVTSRVSIYTLRYAKNACCGESNCLLRRISDLSTSLQVVQNVSTRKSFILLEGKKPFW